MKGTVIIQKKTKYLLFFKKNLNINIVVKLEKGFTRFQALFRGYQARQFFKKRSKFIEETNFNFYNL